MSLQGVQNEANQCPKRQSVYPGLRRHPSIHRLGKRALRSGVSRDCGNREQCPECVQNVERKQTQRTKQAGANGITGPIRSMKNAMQDMCPECGFKMSQMRGARVKDESRELENITSLLRLPSTPGHVMPRIMIFL